MGAKLTDIERFNLLLGGLGGSDALLGAGPSAAAPAATAGLAGPWLAFDGRTTLPVIDTMAGCSGSTGSGAWGGTWPPGA